MAEISASAVIFGLDNLDAALRALPVEVGGPLTLNALRAGGEVARQAWADRIHGRTGDTAADLRVQAQVNASKAEGVAAIGGTKAGTTGRAHVLNWLEFGTRAHPILPRKASRREINRATRALARLDPAAALAFARGVASGGIRASKGGLWWAGARHPIKGLSQAHPHPGMAAQSPATISLLESADQIITTVTTSLRRGIVDVAERFNRGGA